MTGSTLVAPALDPTVTAADMVAGHVVLDISCLDRLYLTGYVAKPIASPAPALPAVRGRSARSSGGL